MRRSRWWQRQAMPKVCAQRCRRSMMWPVVCETLRVYVCSRRLFYSLYNIIELILYTRGVLVGGLGWRVIEAAVTTTRAKELGPLAAEQASYTPAAPT